MKAIGFIDSFYFNLKDDLIIMTVEVPTNRGGSWVTEIHNNRSITTWDMHEIVDSELTGRKVEIVHNNEKWHFSKLI